jgi:NADP-dependent 3-hydroxy acid dehydrogenase YdfG
VDDTEPDRTAETADRATETVLVAGAGERIGAAVARRFARAGRDVALLARSPGFVEKLAAELSEDTRTAAVTADVTDWEAVAAAVERVRERLAPVGCLVCNASAGGGHPFESADAASLERILRTRVVGSFHLVRAVAPDLRPDGTVLFSGTTYATAPTPEQVEWGAGAAGARGLARSLDAGLDGVDVRYVAIGRAVRPPESSFPGALAAGAVADRYLELHEADDPPVDPRIE